MPADSSRPDRRAPSARSKTSGGAGKPRPGAPKGRPGGGRASSGRPRGTGAGSSGRSGAPTGRPSRSDSSGTRRPSRSGASRRDEEEELKSGARSRRSSTGTRNPRGSTGSRTGSGDRTGTGRPPRSSSSSGRPPRREGSTYSSDRPSRTDGPRRAGGATRPARPGTASRDSGAARGGRPPYRGDRDGAGSNARGASSSRSSSAPRRPGASPGRRAPAPNAGPKSRQPFYRPYDDDPLPEGAKKWGNVARRGAREVTARNDDGEQQTARFSDDQERRRTAQPPRPEPWVRVDGSPDEWEDTPPRGRGRGGAKRAAGTGRRSTASSSASTTAVSTRASRKALPPEIAAEIRNAANMATALHKERLVEKAESAYGAFERGRYQDALRAIKPVADETPSVAAVRELAGLAAYRSGKWREALKHLQAHAALTDSAEHLPVLMDCQRALHKPKKVADLWTQLRQSSPEPDVLAEGRIVAAASLADSGDLQGAIAMLATAGASKALRNPSNRHIRQWYLLADLYERAGDIPRARELFERVLRVDREAYDVAERLMALGPVSRPRSPRRTKAKTATSTKTGPPTPSKTKPA